MNGVLSFGLPAPSQAAFAFRPASTDLAGTYKEGTVESVVTVAPIADVRQVGWGLALIVAFGGFRFLLRAVAWRLCLDPPHRLALKDAFAAVICLPPTRISSPRT